MRRKAQHHSESDIVAPSVTRTLSVASEGPKCLHVGSISFILYVTIAVKVPLFFKVVGVIIIS